MISPIWLAASSAPGSETEFQDVTPRARAGVFDWDGTLRPGFTMARWVWFLLSRRHFSLTSLLRLVRIRLAYSLGRLGYDDFSKLAAHAYVEGIAGREVATTLRLAQEFVDTDQRRLFGFVPDLVKALEKREVLMFVVSGAPQIVLDEYQGVMGFHKGYGVLVQETDGVWQATPQPSPAMRAVKQARIDEVRNSGHDILLAVGDSEADIPLLLAAEIRLRFVHSGTKVRGSDWPPGTVDVAPEAIVRTVESALDELLGARAAADDQRREAEGLLYQEAARVASVFWEYRYRMMTVFFTGMAVLIALAGWLYDRELGRFITAPTLLGALLALVLALLERRNTSILRGAYLVAEDIEATWRGGGGVFQRIGAVHKASAKVPWWKVWRVPTFSGVFFYGYLTASVALLALFVLLAFIWALEGPSGSG